MIIDSSTDLEEIKKFFEDKKIRYHVYESLQNLFQHSSAILILNLFEDVIKTGENDWHNSSHFSFSTHSLSKSSYYKILPKLVHIGILDVNITSSDTWNSTKYIRLNEDFVTKILIPLIIFLAKRKMQRKDSD